MKEYHHNQEHHPPKKAPLHVMWQGVIFVVLVLVLIILYFIITYLNKKPENTPKPQANRHQMLQPVSVLPPIDSGVMWKAPDISVLPPGEKKDLILYGRELVVHTSKYLGPKGSVAHLSNGMNCQNCHVDAGTVAWGNNFSATASTYPKYRGRSGTVEDLVKRVNDCMERSLNGQVLAKNSKEMRAMLAYMLWVGQDIPKGIKPKGWGIYKLAYLDRAANPETGKILYLQKCSNCHGKNGEGLPNAEGNGYTYPPLWGENSYNIGAGMYRIILLAGYIKANMPFGANYRQPQLSDEEAWDIAAYVNTMDRPYKNLEKDWPKITEKPIDYPFGPYADQFSEKQHKYGPYKPILAVNP